MNGADKSHAMGDITNCSQSPHTLAITRDGDTPNVMLTQQLLTMQTLIKVQYLASSGQSFLEARRPQWYENYKALRYAELLAQVI